MLEKIDENALTQFDEKALSILDNAKSITIDDDDQYVEVGQYLIGMKKYLKDLDATFKEPLSAARATVKALNDAKERHAGPILEAEKLVKERLATYERNRRALIEAENKKAAEELAKREKEKANGTKETVPYVPPPAPKEMPKLEGVSYQKCWITEVTNLDALLSSVGNKSFPFSLSAVEQDLISALMPHLRKFADATKGTVAIPGVTITHSQIVKGRV